MHKISIIGRGNGALGYTLYRPEEDRLLHTRTSLENAVSSLLGVRWPRNWPWARPPMAARAICDGPPRSPGEWLSSLA